MIPRVPVHPVCGPPEARAAWLARIKEGGAVLSARSCPCCVGRVEMQIGLARLLRERRPERIFVDLRDATHLATFEKVLSEWPLAQYVAAGRAIRLPQDGPLDCNALGD
jgi:hypothetical protein